MSDVSPWTIKRLLEWTAGYLRDHGSDSGRLDAEVLLAESRGCQRIDLYASFDEVPAAEIVDRFRNWVRQRAEGMPVAYLVGHREFYSLEFEVTPDVLIPRPETEFIVLEALDRAPLHDRVTQQVSAPQRSCEIQQERLSDDPILIADIGTGSGCLAVTLATNLPQARVTAIDISEAALDVARRNAEKHDVIDRVELIQGNLFDSLPDDRRFDLIVSNPPYIGRSEQGTVDEQVARHEPEVALFAGDDGLAVINPLVQQASERLNLGGWLIFEISPFIAAACRKLVEDRGRFAEITVRQDLDRLDRVMIARRSRPA